MQVYISKCASWRDSDPDGARASGAFTADRYLLSLLIGDILFVPAAMMAMDRQQAVTLGQRVADELNVVVQIAE